jgi:hypothetical protein
LSPREDGGIDCAIGSAFHPARIVIDEEGVRLKTFLVQEIGGFGSGKYQVRLSPETPPFS